MTAKILFPPLDEQKRIATILDTVRREIDLHQKQLAALMQKRLTGQWRMKV